MKVDHIALVVDSPKRAADWYCNEFGAKKMYEDDTWALVQFDNIKIAFVVKHQHPSHFAFLVDDFPEEGKARKHRDGSESCYNKDPWGNIYELIRYDDEQE